MIARIKQDVLTAYGSFGNPNWSFVVKRMKEGWYRELEPILLDMGSVQETTDLNDDCSRSFAVQIEGEALTLRLSLVGRYACIHDASASIFDRNALLLSELGRRLLHLVEQFGIALLNATDLQSKVEFGGQPVCLYAVLFSDDELIA
jgi:hypothetical protein